MVAKVGALPAHASKTSRAAPRAIKCVFGAGVAWLALMNATTRLSRGGHAVVAAGRESPSPSRNVTKTAATASTLLTGESEGTTVWGTSTFRVREAKPQKVRLCCRPTVVGNLTVDALRRSVYSTRQADNHRSRNLVQSLGSATISSVEGMVATNIYSGELGGSKTKLDLRLITGAADLLAAVAADERRATLRAVTRIVYHSIWHIVRLRVLDAAGRVLADFGGRYVIAPAAGVLRSATGGVVLGAS